MKDEVFFVFIDVYVKMVEDVNKEGKFLDVEFGLEKSGIVGIVFEKEEGTKVGMNIFLEKFLILM